MHYIWSFQSRLPEVLSSFMDFSGNNEGRSCGSCPRVLTTIYCVDCLCYQPHEPFQIVSSVCFALFGSNCFENVKISSKCSRFTNIFTWFIVGTREDCNSAYRALNHSVTHTRGIFAPIRKNSSRFSCDHETNVVCFQQRVGKICSNPQKFSR